MKHTLKLISALLICLFVTEGLMAQKNWVRTPAISPDGSKIAFSYQGDIWTANADGSEARRMTVHEAYESNPQFSPDGKKILFVGNRFGNNDLFEISESGNVNRLTYHSTSDYNGRYDNDGNIAFNSRRLNVHVEREPEVQVLKTGNGTPERMMDALGFNPTCSADGRYVAFERGSCRTERETYRGPAQRDIWVYDTKNNSYTQVTSDERQDIQPNWSSDGSLYFLSARNGKYNIYHSKMNAGSFGEQKKISVFKEDGIRHFNISSNGKYAIIELADELRMMELSKGGKGKLVQLNLPKDSRYDSYEHKTLRNGLGQYAISPDGKKMAATIRGEVFVFENSKENKITKNISNSPFRDQGAEWLNDSTLLFMSDRSGEYDLYMANSTDTSRTSLLKSYKINIKKLRDTDNDMASFLLSPDRTKVVLRDGRGKMSVAEISDSTGIQNEIVLLDSWATPSGISWSPDSKWLAYSKADLDFNNEIYIHKADGSSDPINVSMHPRSDSNPVWSPDGSKLGFESIRNNGDSDLWFAWLKKEDWERTSSEWEMMEDNKKKSDSIVVDIDLDNIYRRLVQVTSMAGNERNLTISKDGETFLFTTNGGGRAGSGGKSVLMSVKWDGSELKELNKSSVYGLSYDPSSKKYYYLSRGNIYKSDKGSKGEKISFTAKMDVLKYEERAQIFDEAWRALEAGFYDPQFHGQDFEALKKKYRPRALAASTQQEFRLQFNEMIGQLDASHMGMYGSNPEETQRERTGLIGAELEGDAIGYLVTSVVPGSPADREESKLNIGDRVRSVNGKSVSGSKNFYRHLQGLANTKVLLEVEDKDGQMREVLISPVSSLRTVLYDAWVAERRALTEEYSGGKLGYIHIRGMNWPSFENFERELMASGYGKEGIVIDVRFNGGGWTTDMMMAVLNVKQHSYTVPRGAVDNLEKENKRFKEHYPYGERLPLSSWTKPSIALCNQNSYSNAEIFSHAYKALGHGQLVGVPTFGAVISTGGKGLIDGSYVRMPFRAWYVKDSGMNMEHGPAVPDIILYNNPDSKSKGVDEQLKKAVDLLLEDI